MPLQPGTVLGPYSVTAKIGEGGMGEVYRARDTKLDRDVALKVLPQAFTDDPDRLARFEREAKVLASLNHTNIGHIYGLEEAEGQRALVLELVEGPTLADRIKQGPIPVDEALPIATQIAEALEAAHEQGIIHRDLKPANIKVKDDGTVKVLDFGLAKAFQPDAGDPNMSQSPTISLTAAATQMGMVIGTAAYMSPEQARGRPVDHRSDVWAFGAVLFEMLTGRRAFQNEDVSLTLAEVMKGEPDWQALPSDLSPSLKGLVQRCVTKDVRQRLQHIGEARIALTGPALLTHEGDEPSASTHRERWRWASVLLGLLAASTIGVLIGRSVTPAFESPDLRRRFEILTQDAQVIAPSGGRLLALSRDGARLAYVDRSTIYVRNLRDGFEGVPITGLDRSNLVGVSPFFSPDGEWLAYTVGGTLVVAWLNGEGEPRTVCDRRATLGGVWTEEGDIIFSAGGSLWTVPSSGGECRRFAPPDSQPEDDTAGRYLQPQALPGGQVLLAELVEDDQSKTVLVSRETGELLSVLAEDAASPRYSPTGHLLFLRGQTLFATPFDATALQVTGGVVPVLDSVDSGTLAQFDFAEDGSLAYVPVNAEPELGLVWVDRTGREERIDVRSEPYWAPRVSPDGDRVAVVVRGDGARVHLVDVMTGTLDFFVEGIWPAWTRDGQRLAFQFRSGGRRGAWWRQVEDRDATPEPIEAGGPAIGNLDPDATPGLPGAVVLSFSTDPVVLTYYRVGGRTNTRDIWVTPVDPPGASTTAVSSEADDWAPHLSPDARYLAYASDVSGGQEVYVTTCGPCRPDLELSGRIWRVSVDGGTAPVWSADGQELFYVQGTTMMAVTVRTDPDFDHDPPRPLFEDNGYVPDQFGNQNYDVSPDGQRFVMVKSSGSITGRHRINVVLNWHQELLERVPVP